jgi:hypothetical protein
VLGFRYWIKVVGNIALQLSNVKKKYFLGKMTDTVFNSEGEILDLSDIKCGKGTCFVFTSWDVEPPLWNGNVMWYLAYAQESAETTGGRHWQGYVQMMCQQRNVAVKKELNLKRGYVAAQKAACAEVARAYVFKLDTKIVPAVQFGTFRLSEQGKRTDIDNFVEAAQDLATNKRQMYKDHKACMVKYPRAYVDIRATFTEPRDWKTYVTHIYGPTGSGKSRYVHEKYGAKGYYPMRVSNRGWWDDYDNHEIVLIDDFKGWLMVAEMLDLLDRYPMTVQIKGGRAQFVAKRIYITSVHGMSTWWNKEALGDRYAELARRIDKTVHIDLLKHIQREQMIVELADN